jgi:bacteriocin-like protein
MSITAAQADSVSDCLGKVAKSQTNGAGIMTTAINAAATSKPVREPSRELTEDELAHVSGGIIAILIGLLLPAAPHAPVQSK